MVFRIPALLSILAVLAIPQSDRAGQTSPAEPRYDPAATVEFTGVVIETREVPRPGPLHGLHVIVENGKESLDVYLGPVEFMKQFDFFLNKGDRVDIVGSRVKSAGGAIVLAREVRRQSQTVYLRDSAGSPYWPAGS